MEAETKESTRTLKEFPKVPTEVGTPRVFKILFLILGVGITALGLFMLALIQVFTLRTISIAGLGVGSLFASIIFTMIESRTRPPEMRVCERCDVELASLTCLRCGKWIGSKCNFPGTPLCIVCGSCLICASGLAGPYCIRCRRSVCRDCFDRDRGLCIECLAARNTGSHSASNKVYAARVIVAECESQTSRQMAAILGEHLKGEVLSGIVRADDEIKTLGTVFRILGTSPSARNVKVLEKTKVVVVPAGEREKLGT